MNTGTDVFSGWATWPVTSTGHIVRAEAVTGLVTGVRETAASITRAEATSGPITGLGGAAGPLTTAGSFRSHCMFFHRGWRACWTFIRSRDLFPMRVCWAGLSRHGPGHSSDVRLSGTARDSRTFPNVLLVFRDSIVQLLEQCKHVVWSLPLLEGDGHFQRMSHHTPNYFRRNDEFRILLLSA